MQHNSRGGFLPLMAIIAIAIVIAAGTTVTVVLHHREAEKQPEPAAAPAPEAVVGQDSARVATSGQESGVEPVRHPAATVEARVAKEAAGSGLSAEEIAQDRLEQEEAVARQKARAQAMNEELQRAITEGRSSAGSSHAPDYDKAKCDAQRRSLLSQADATYLQWWDDYQEAKRGMDSCYSSNSQPVCDKKMTDLNVAWQAKLDARFEPLYSKLTSCASEDRRFGDISTVVSAGY